jgi:hypothetical protein
LLDPGSLETGVNYHHAAISKWVARNSTCPATRLQLNSCGVQPAPPSVKAGAVAWVRSKHGLPRILQRGKLNGPEREAIKKLVAELSVDNLASVAPTLAILAYEPAPEDQHPLLEAPSCRRLMGFLQSPHNVVKFIAATAVASNSIWAVWEDTNCLEVGEGLLALLDSDNEGVQLSAMNAMDSMGEGPLFYVTRDVEVVAKLVRLARTGNNDVQWKAVELLGTLFMQDFEDFKDDDGSLREMLIGVFLNHPSHCA